MKEYIIVFVVEVSLGSLFDLKKDHQCHVSSVLETVAV
jgi:hypothetical protein